MTGKKDFLETQKALFKEWTRQIDELKGMAKKAQVDASVKFDNYIDDLRVRYEDALSQLEDTQNSGDSRWEELKTAVDLAWEELKLAIEKAKKVFR
jgi:DNA-binding transcriptional regulator GbsR (MarR family)